MIPSINAAQQEGKDPFRDQSQQLADDDKRDKEKGRMLMMEEMARGAAEWNERLLSARHSRGPLYWEPHSRTAQALPLYGLCRTPYAIQFELLATYLQALPPDQQQQYLLRLLQQQQQHAPPHTASAPAPVGSGPVSGSQQQPSSVLIDAT